MQFFAKPLSANAFVITEVVALVRHHVSERGTKIWTTPLRSTQITKVSHQGITFGVMDGYLTARCVILIAGTPRSQN